MDIRLKNCELENTPYFTPYVTGGKVLELHDDVCSVACMPEGHENPVCFKFKIDNFVDGPVLMNEYVGIENIKWTKKDGYSCCLTLNNIMLNNYEKKKKRVGWCFC